MKKAKRYTVGYYTLIEDNEKGSVVKYEDYKELYDKVVQPERLSEGDTTLSENDVYGPFGGHPLMEE